MVRSIAVAVFTVALALVAVSAPWIRSSIREAHFKRRLAAFGQRLETVQKARADLQARSNGQEPREEAAAHIAQELTVGAGNTQSFDFTAFQVPGTLIGAWRASTDGLVGADGSLAAFRLTDSSGNVLAMSQHESNGKFAVKISAIGVYTFYFDNAGSVRTVPRKVLLEADFFAD